MRSLNPSFERGVYLRSEDGVGNFGAPVFIIGRFAVGAVGVVRKVMVLVGACDGLALVEGDVKALGEYAISDFLAPLLAVVTCNVDRVG